MEQEGQHISGVMAILCIVNGMIGGLILLLPVMALESGWLLTLIVILITGFISYYSCHLCLLHTGTEPDLDIAILKHFNGNKKLKIFYELCILGNLLIIDILYYQLIVLQWEGLVPPYTIWNPVINFSVLLTLTLVIKFKQFGATLMAYGIVSIAAYLLFITWVVGSQQPKNDGHSLKLFNGSGGELAAALGQAFAIQCFFIPILKKNKKAHKHKLYLVMSFILGGLAYSYMAFMGSYGILHRKYRDTDVKDQKTIQGYFQVGMWQVSAIEIIYLVHLYSVFPEYLLIGKKRFFSIFQIKQSEVGRINKKQLIYILSILGFCLGMALLRTSLRNLIDLNGAVLGFFFIYFFPAIIHFKCCYFNKKGLLQEQKKQKMDLNYVQMVQQQQNKNKPIGSSSQTPEKYNAEPEPQNVDHKDGVKNKGTLQTRQTEPKTPSNIQSDGSSKAVVCQGKDRTVSKAQKIAELSVLGIMLVLGLIIMGLGIKKMVM